MLCNCSQKRGVRICERKNSADTKVNEEGGGVDALGAGAEIPLQQPLMKTMVRQAVPLQPMEVHGGADVHLQPGEDPMPEQGDARRRLWPRGKPTLEQDPGRSCGPVERGAHAGAGFLAGLVTPWGTHAGAVCA